MNSSAPSPKPTEKKCIACQSPIPVDSTKCAICKEFQSKWRNQLAYLSTAAAGISLVAAAFTFVFSNSNEVRKFFAWKDAAAIVTAVADADAYDATTIISNIGDGDLILLQLTYYLKGRDQGASITFVPEGIIKSGQTHTHQQTGKQAEGVTRYVAAEDETACKSIIDKAAGEARRCYSYVAFSSNHPSLVLLQKTFEQDKKTLCAFASAAVLTAFSPKSDKQVEFPFNVKTVIMQHTGKANCGGAQKEG